MFGLLQERRYEGRQGILRVVRLPRVDDNDPDTQIAQMRRQHVHEGGLASAPGSVNSEYGRSVDPPQGIGERFHELPSAKEGRSRAVVPHHDWFGLQSDTVFHRPIVVKSPLADGAPNA